MIESVMEEEDDRQEIKDQQGGGGGATEEDLTGIVVVVTSAEEEEEEEEGDDDNDNDGGVKKSKESEFELSKKDQKKKKKKKKKVSVVVDKALKPNVVVAVSESESESESEPEPPPTCVIDVKCCSSNVGNKLAAAAGGGGENCDVEKVCRICHLSVESPSDNSADMIQLGCGCKDELGIAHRHCAETWFKLKGNRCCEICGQAAKNITGMWDDRFMEDWNDRRSVGSNSLDRRWGFWRGQPFCNFLMACLVMAFVLPWFFRVNMF